MFLFEKYIGNSVPHGFRKFSLLKTVKCVEAEKFNFQNNFHFFGKIPNAICRQLFFRYSIFLFSFSQPPDSLNNVLLFFFNKLNISLTVHFISFKITGVRITLIIRISMSNERRRKWYDSGVKWRIFSGSKTLNRAILEI